MKEVTAILFILALEGALIAVVLRRIAYALERRAPSTPKAEDAPPPAVEEGHDSPEDLVPVNLFPRRPRRFRPRR